MEFKTLDKNPIRNGIIIEADVNNLLFRNKSDASAMKPFLWIVMICKPPIMNKRIPLITENS